MVGSILFAIETKDEYMRNELAEEIRMFVAEEDANIVVKIAQSPYRAICGIPWKQPWEISRPVRKSRERHSTNSQ